jgi:excisionase family DNA binding protein
MNERILMNALEAAEYLSVSRTTIYQLMAKGELKGVSVGRSRRFPRQELDEFVDRLRTQALAEAV